MWESVLFHQKNKSFPVPLRCSAVSHCHIHLSSELTELTLLTIHPNAFWLLGWNALSSNSQSESTATTALLLPSSRLQHWAADAVAYSTAAPWNTGFSAPRLFFVFSRSFFFAWPITFLHFYQRTSISEIWLHLLLLPRQHCVSSLRQGARTAAAGVGGELTDRHTCSSTARIRLYQNPLLPEWLPEQATYKAGGLVSSQSGCGKLIVTLSTQGWSWPHPGQFFLRRQNKATD